jgi:hypothetical protein
MTANDDAYCINEEQPAVAGFCKTVINLCFIKCRDILDS